MEFNEENVSLRHILDKLANMENRIEEGATTEYREQLQNTGPFVEVFYLKRLGGSPVALSV